MRDTLIALLLLLAGACSPGVPRVGPDGPDGPDGPHDPRLPRPDFESERARYRAALQRGDLDAATVAVERLGALASTAAERALHAELSRVIAFLRDGTGDDAVEGLLRRHVPASVLPAFRGLAADTRAGGWVHTRLALIALHGGDGPALARDVLGRVRHEPYREALRRALLAWERRSAARASPTLGVLLPLSGPYREIGEAALRSIQMAAGRRLKLVVKDTRGEASVAARQVERLVLDHQVAAILGPVGEIESTAAARRATELQVPILVLTARETIAADSPWVFRTRLTRARKGVFLARHAVREMGLRRFALLVSDSDLGWGLAGAFWTELERLGAEVTQVVTYPRGSRAYRAIVAGLLGGARRGRVDFDGLLIADDFRMVRKLAPLFPSLGLKIRRRPGARGTVQLLGGAGWNHPLIVDEAEQQTDNAVFVDGFFRDETDGGVDRFVRTFYDKFRVPPGTFDAEVYDAARVIAGAVGRGSADRGAVRDALRGIKAFRGVTGLIRFDANGEPLKDPYLLTVHKDRIRLRASEAEERATRAAP